MSGDPVPGGHTLAFVAGLHRSGTSLLHRMLRAHPEASGFAQTGVREDEGQHLQSVVPTAADFGGPGRFGLDPRARLDETSPLATPENAERIFAEWARHWDLDKRVLVEKSPPTLLRMRFFQALFPGARFVVLLRHPIAVAAATQKWAYLPVEPLLEHTLACYETACADLAHLEHAFVLRYEDLVTAPDAAFAGVCEFLGLAPVAAREAVRADVNAVYFDAWRRGLFAPVRRRRLAEAEEARARRFGYSLLEPEAELPLRLEGTRAATFARPGPDARV